MFFLPSLILSLFLITQDEPILQPGSKVEKIVTGCKFTEGPAVDGAGNLFFSDGPNDRIMKLTPDGKLNEFR
jgi:gluconolactonase